jgi:L-amino acid N-acyltransferase YncA
MLGASSALSMKGDWNKDSWNLCASETPATADREVSAYLAPQARSKSTQGTELRLIVRVLLQQGLKGAVSAISTPIH